jgi:mevalonate kinase
VRDFPSKILLFGEYGILVGSRGLSVPYPAFTGTFRFHDSSAPEISNDQALFSNHQIRLLSGYFNSRSQDFQFLDLGKLSEDLDKGLWFDSNIPQGYGAGSSGALTAAIFDLYGSPEAKNLQLPEIRLLLASMESCFHGTSSGLDPLVSWANAPILIDGKTSIRKLEQVIFPGRDHEPGKLQNSTMPDPGLFLVDTRIVGKTGNFVQVFMDNYHHDWEYRRAIDEVYLPAISQAIDELLQQKFAALHETFSFFSAFQMQYLSAMIPAGFTKQFEHGLDTGDFYLKLCGSGGGGFMLGMCSDREKCASHFLRIGSQVHFLGENDEMIRQPGA